MRGFGAILGGTVLWTLAAMGAVNYLTMSRSVIDVVSVPIGLLVFLAVWVGWKRRSRAVRPSRDHNAETVGALSLR